MLIPNTVEELFAQLLNAHLVSADKVAELRPVCAGLPLASAIDLLVKNGVLSRYQGEKTLTGRMRELMVGPYRLISPIGQGGMGTVFLADHISLSRRVALKIFPPERKNDRAALERFAREAKATAALDHPNIVKIHDIGQHDELNYLVMEFVDGQNLEQLINQRGQLSVSEAVGYVAQTASGLQHAFERGVVHRDIKPANLLLDHTGNIKILDMGLARFFTGEDDLTQRLDEGAILGTADFISPEQALDGKVDIRADIYSLGATFYTLLAGQPPFGGKSASQKLLAHQMRVATAIHRLRSDIPQEISDVVSKMMAKNPDDRFRTPAEVISALLPWIPEQVVVLGSNSGPLPRPAPKPRQNWSLLIATISVVTLLLVLSVWIAVNRPFEQVAKNAASMSIPQDKPFLRWLTEDLEAGETRVQQDKVLTGCRAFLKESRFSTWAQETIAEAKTQTIDGKKVLTMRNLEGTPSAMLFVPFSGIKAKTLYRLEIDFKAKGEQQQGFRILVFGQETQTVGQPVASGKWQTFRYEWEQKQDGDGWIEIHPRDDALGVFHLARVEITQPPNSPPPPRRDKPKPPE